VSEPLTLIERVFSLPPGHRLLLHLPERRRFPRARPWWDPRQSPSARDPKRPRDFPSAAAELGARLTDAVRAHLIADVPVGLFLSSGLDSGALAVLATEVAQRIQSFTLTFPNTAYDEGPVASELARHAGTSHQEVPLEASEMLVRIDEAVAALDQPSMDGINTYFVSWAAREVGLKVALSGLGGDELFAGYQTFEDTQALTRLQGLSRLVPGALRRLGAPLLDTVLRRWQSPDAARKASDAWKAPEIFPHPYFFTRLLFPPSELPRLTDPCYRKSTVAPDGVTLEPTWLGWLELVSDQAKAEEPIGGISWLELRTYLASTLLRDTDSVSMARSLEVRVPFLDAPLVDMVAALPDAARFQPGVPKALLRAALGDRLPAVILAQKKKTFTLPWEDWLRTSLREKVSSSLNEVAPALADPLHRSGVRRVWEQFERSETSWSRPWSLYVLNEWCRRHLS